MSLEQILGYINVVADWAVPFLIFLIPVVGLLRGVKVYEVFVEGAKEGFQVAVTIMPYLVAILVAIGLLRDSNAMDVFVRALQPFTGLIGMPADLLPMAVIRPLSGSGALGYMNSVLIEYGPDSYNGMLASVMMGSTETTFYILAVYFGAVNIKKSRHAVLAGLAGDFGGLLAAVILSSIVFRDLLPT